MSSEQLRASTRSLHSPVLVFSLVLFLSGCSWIRSLDPLVRAIDTLRQNEVTFMSYNIQHDNAEFGAFWAVEWVIADDLNFVQRAIRPQTIWSLQTSLRGLTTTE